MYDGNDADLIEDPNYEPECNASDNRTFNAICEARFARRNILRGGAASLALGFMGVAEARGPAQRRRAAKLGFDSLPLSEIDDVRVPDGYSATPFLSWGTPITGSYPAYLDGGFNTGAEQEQQVGMHHDGMHFFPIGDGRTHGLLTMNHEYIEQQYMHPNGATFVDGVRTIPDEVRKELAAHGVSVVEIEKKGGEWEVVRGRFNRRVTANTPMEFTGPVRGADHVKTLHDPQGLTSRGTLNNCAHGYTAWDTYLTCEENWAGYFFSDDEELPREQARYGVRTNGRGRYGWGTVDSVDDYTRFNASTRGASATEDYRNEPNTFGWVVEIDPFDPTSTPKKRTALGRFAHEGAWMAPVRHGQPVVVYMGDDARFEYVYKFISKNRYFNRRDNRDLLEEGTLYVARFNEDGSGEWVALVHGRNGLTPENGFADQADVLVNTRTAADFVGATPMDRAEWGTIDTRNDTIYMTFTNNSRRGNDETDAANPRGPNRFGHIIRWEERGAGYTGLKFNWNIFILAGPPENSINFGAPGAPALDDTNAFSSPDGLWYDNGLLWIQTDGNFTGNDQMLACVPETGEIRRFFTSVIRCEVTGVVATTDSRTLFVNVQHPGEGSFGSSNWPDGGNARPRSSTVIVERNDGGVVGQ